MTIQNETDPPDPLDFLASPSPSPTASRDAAKKMQATKEEQEERERAQTILEIQNEIRALSVQQLLDLRSTIPPVVLSAAQLEHLINLLIRVFSFGLIKGRSPVADAIAARDRLATMAREELARRRKTPTTARGKLDALNEYHQAVQERATVLEQRAPQHQLHPRAAQRDKLARDRRREQLEAGFDRLQVHLGSETLVIRKAQLAAEVASHRAAKSEPEVAVGFGMVMLPGSRAKAAAVQAAAARSKRIALAAARQAAAQAAVDEFMATIEREQQKEEQQRAEEQQAAAGMRAAEAQERTDLARELHQLPEQLVEARREELNERKAKHQNALATATAAAAEPGAVAAPHLPPSDADFEADELAATEEREELRRRLGKGG